MPYNRLKYPIKHHKTLVENTRKAIKHEITSQRVIALLKVCMNNILFKYVRSRDTEDVGNVVSVDENFITMMRGQHKFKLPNQLIEGYNGSEVYLNISARELYNHELKI